MATFQARTGTTRLAAARLLLARLLIARLLLAGLLLGGVTACGQGASGGSGATGAATGVAPGAPIGVPTASPSSVPPAPPASGMPGPSPLPEPSHLPFPTPSITAPVAGQRQTSTPWTLVRAEGTTVVVQVVSGGPPCTAVTGADVTETETTVTITTWTGPIDGTDASFCAGPQPAIAAIQWIRVTLEAPAASRTLLQGGPA